MNEYIRIGGGGIPASQKGAPNGVATLDGAGKIPSSQLPAAVLLFQGTWNASTNSPFLQAGVGNLGDMYICNVQGTQDLGHGPTLYHVGDYIIYDGIDWDEVAGPTANFPLYAPDGTVTAPQYSFGNGITTGLYFNPTGNSLGVAQNGVNRLLINDSQFTITPAGGTPTLTVNGDVLLPGYLLTVGPGSDGIPSYNFYGDTDTGIRNPGSGWIVFVMNGLDQWGINNGILYSAYPTNAGSLIRGGNGTASAPSLSTNDDVNTGIYFPSGDVVGISCGGTLRHQFTTGQILTGNGTGLAPAYSFAAYPATGIAISNPNSMTMVVNGQSAWTFSDVGQLFTYKNDAYSNIYPGNGSASVPAYNFMQDSGQNTGMYRISEDVIGFTCGGSLEFRIDSAGLKTIDGQQSAPSISFISDTNTGMYLDGPDRLCFSTNGTNRWGIDPTGIFYNPNPGSAAAVIQAGTGSVSAPTYAFNTNESKSTGMYLPAAYTLGFVTNAIERARFTLGGQLLIGSTSARSMSGTTNALQVEGTNASNSRTLAMLNSNDGAGSYHCVAKSRGTTIGAVTAVQNGDDIGGMGWFAADGSTLNSIPATFKVQVDGTVGTGVVPGKMQFYTANSGGTQIERLTIYSSGIVAVQSNQLSITAASAGSPGLVFNGDSNTGIFSDGADRINFATGGSHRWGIDPSGLLYVPDPNASGTCIRGGKGTAGAPTYAFNSNEGSNVGMYLAANYTIGFSCNGSQAAQLSAGQFLVPQGSQGNPGFSFMGDPNTGIYDDGGDRLAFSTNSNIRWGIAPSGEFYCPDPDAAGARIRGAKGSAASPSYAFNYNEGQNTGIFSPANYTVGISANGSEKMRVLPSGTVLVGSTVERTGGEYNSRFQLEGVQLGTSAALLVCNENLNTGAFYDVGKSRSGTIGGVATVQVGDSIGGLKGFGADGSSLNNIVGKIEFIVDATPAANKVPGKISFYTANDTPGGTLFEKMSINNTGKVSILRDQLLVTDGTTINPAISFIGAVGMGLTRSGNDMIFCSNGVAQWTMNEVGQLFTNRNGTSTAAVYSGNGSASTPSFNFIGDDQQNTGMFRAAEDTIGFACGGGCQAQIDISTTPGDTRLLLWDVSAGALVRVTRGAVDSGGTGYRVLRIPN